MWNSDSSLWRTVLLCGLMMGCDPAPPFDATSLIGTWREQGNNTGQSVSVLFNTPVPTESQA